MIKLMGVRSINNLYYTELTHTFVGDRMNKVRSACINESGKPITLDEILAKNPRPRPDKAQPLPNLCAQGEVQRVPVLH